MPPVRPHPLLAAAWLLLQPADAQMYSSGVGKTTHLVSDATQTLEWLTAHLPVFHDVAGLNCTKVPGSPLDEAYCACGQAGRTGLACPDCPPCPGCQPWGKTGPAFGLHTISYNASLPYIQRPTPRPIGDMPIETIEAHVTRKLEAAAAAAGYDALLDFNTGFWVEDLDPFIRRFSGSRTLPVEWRDPANGRTYYSLLVQVASAFYILEFMSARQTILPARRHVSRVPRFLFKAGETPEALFPPLNDTAGGVPLPRPARVSHYTSDVARDATYYEAVLRRDTSAVLQGDDGSSTLVLNFEDMSVAPNYVQLHLVQRRADATHGALTVAELERVMNRVHDKAHTSDVCGWDQFNDFHYSVATQGWMPLSEVLPRIEALGYKYHTGTTTWHPDGSLLTLFAMAPNGITIQLHNMAKGNYTPSLPPVFAHGGLCSIGPPACESGHDV